MLRDKRYNATIYLVTAADVIIFYNFFKKK